MFDDEYNVFGTFSFKDLDNKEIVERALKSEEQDQEQNQEQDQKEE